MSGPSRKASENNVSPRVRIASILLVLFALSSGEAAAATPFQAQKVDSIRGSGIHNSLALDSRQQPHISYFGNSAIMYASRVDTTWAIELVDSVGDVGYYTSLALDSDDAPHISYFDLGNANLRYATKAPGYWVTELVDSTGSVGQYGSIALDQGGNPSMTYYDNTNGNLKYAARVNGVWSTEIADSAGNVGFYTSLAFDGLGQPCVSYLDLEGGLKFARKTPAGWEVQAVEPNDNVGAFSSLAIDASGFAHISYADLSFNSLKYAREIPGGFQTETVDGTNRAGSFTSIQLVAGSPRITYVALGTHNLMYAVRAGFGWNTEFIDSTTKVDSFNSLKMDAEGNPKVSYYDMDREILKFADSSVHLIEPRGGELWAAGTAQRVVWAGIGPVDIYLSQDGGVSYTKVNSSPAADHETLVMVPSWSTATARAKVVRTAFPSSSESPGLFFIAPGLASPWWTKLVDASGITGITPSLTLTADGSPRISYWDTSTGSVRYASRASGVWTSETVSGGLGAHTRSPIAINPYGVPAVAYFDNVHRTVNCAFRVSGVWNSEIIRSLTVTGEDCSLALDRFGSPRVTYYESAPGRLVLASRFGTTWATDDVDHGVGVGIMSSLALDSLGYPYIGYYDQPDGDLRFGTLSGGSWLLETVDRVGDVGAYPSVAVDQNGRPHVSYIDLSNGFLKYATKTPAGWKIETVDLSGDVDGTTSIAIDPLGAPHIAYHANHRLKVAAKVDGIWRTETVEPALGGGRMSALALDRDGNSRIAYLDDRSYDLRYASSAVELGDPVPGARWPIGAHRTIRWEGIGSVDVALSQDSGATYTPLAAGVGTGSFALQVPDLPTTVAKVRIRRTIPFSTSISDTFTIAAGIDVLTFRADPVPFAPGANVVWETDPTVPDLTGYRLERALDGIVYTVMVALTTEMTFRDPAAVPGTRYRLTAIRGTGSETTLGEVEFRPRRPLAAGPLPFRGGNLAISFAVGGTGVAPGPVEVRLYDMRGRLVRTILRGNYAPGFRSADWNGTDERGRRIASGIYFLKAVSPGHEESLKITVLR